ncbi:hypothetical protein ACFL30_01745 [Candidatus Latescibacterota bacterium]
MAKEHNNVNLVKFLYRQYRDKGLIVFSDILPDSNPIPESWVGNHPDILITYRDHSEAVCVETYESLSDEKVTSKWESILENSHARLTVIVREVEELKAVKHLAKYYKLDIQIKKIKRTAPDKRRVRVKRKRKRGLKFDKVIVITSLMILSVSLLLFGPYIAKLFKIQDFYRPFDVERQINLLEKRAGGK